MQPHYFSSHNRCVDENFASLTLVCLVYLLEQRLRARSSNSWDRMDPRSSRACRPPGPPPAELRWRLKLRHWMRKKALILIEVALEHYWSRAKLWKVHGVLVHCCRPSDCPVHCWASRGPVSWAVCSFAGRRGLSDGLPIRFQFRRCLRRWQKLWMMSWCERGVGSGRWAG